MEAPSALLNWFPYRLTYDQKQGWLAEWAFLGTKRITEPFFFETLMYCRAWQLQESHHKSFSDMNMMVEHAEGTPGIPPSAFIFHVSRCGSTLLCQAFATQAETVVISECQLLDEILRASERDSRLTLLQKEKWFRSALFFLGHLHSGTAESFIVKLDCWHIHFYDMLRQWFPETPFYFLSRSPQDVMSSHKRIRGMHMVPGLVNHELLGIDESVDYGGDFDTFGADVLQYFYEQLTRVKQLKHPGNSFYDYEEGATNMVTHFSEFSGIEIKDNCRLKERLGFHSKSITDIFIGEVTLDQQVFPHENCKAAYDRLRTMTKSDPGKT